MVESLFSGCHFAFVGVDAHIDPIKITNSPRISAKQHILPGRCGHRPLRLSIEQTLSEFHTSNIQRARTEWSVRPIVHSGNPIRRPPEGRSLQDAPSVNGIQKQNAFSARQRYSRPQRLFFAYFFSDKPEKSMPPEARPCCATKNGRTANIKRLSAEAESLLLIMK